MTERYRCTSCGWEGEHRERIWVRQAGDVPPKRGFICPQCYEATTERVEQPPEPEEKGYLGTVEWKGWEVDLVQGDEDD